jgi:hypothetical protein
MTDGNNQTKIADMPIWFIWAILFTGTNLVVQVLQ